MGFSKRTAEYEALARVIREAREDLGLSQRKLAEKVGRPSSSINKIESGRQRVDVLELNDIARALRVGLPEIAARIEKALADLG